MMFGCTMRSLGQRSGSCWPLFAGTALFGVWLTWMFMAEFETYTTSTEARLEVQSSPRRIAAQRAARLVTWNAELGQLVTEGQVVGELDKGPIQARQDVDQAELATVRENLEALEVQITAVESLRRQRARVGGVGIRQAQLEEAQAKALFDLEADLTNISRELHSNGLNSRAELVSAERGFVSRNYQVVEASVRIEKSKQEVNYNDRAAAAQLAELHSRRAELRGMQRLIEVRRANYALELRQHLLVAPISGRIGSLSGVEVGDVVEVGRVVASVVPDERVVVVAQFAAKSAAGHVAPGQRATLRLDRFPWLEHGVVHAVVERIAIEPERGTLRIELAVEDESRSRLPLSHGLTGAVEIHTGNASPWSFVSRGAGAGLAKRPVDDSLAPQSARRLPGTGIP